MNASGTLGTVLDWAAANQRHLTAELDRLERLLEDPGPRAARAGTSPAGTAAAGEQNGRAATGPRADETPAPVDEAAIDTVARAFRLSGFERDVLLLAAGVELRASLAERCAAAPGASRGGHPTFAQALAVLPDAHWSAVTPDAPLRRWRLVTVNDRDSLVRGRLRVDERVLHLLAGINQIDDRLRTFLRPVHTAPLRRGAHRQTAERILALHSRGNPGVVQLVGDDPAGQEDVAAAVAAGLGLELLALDVSAVPGDPESRDTVALLLRRESRLAQVGLLLTVDPAPDPVGPASTAARFVDALAPADDGLVVLLAGREPIRLRRPGQVVIVDKPDAAEQQKQWLAVLGNGDDPDGAVGQRCDVSAEHRVLAGRLAAHFRLSARDIGRIGGLAADGDPATRASALWEACQVHHGQGLSALATRVTPNATWDDLVLPEAPMATLRQLAAHVAHRYTVDEEWGFGRTGRRGVGISALFAGDSGTGKTMAAEVLATHLALALHRIDLSAVVSKYIGETEKNLRRVFDAAEACGAILLFDEADALFGRRSEVRDSHDRYANIEVSYLLQRMETHRGLTILTTNHERALDPAFQRRLRAIVRFPFPDVARRAAIWRCVFPPAAPVADLDFDQLARLNVAGGSIRNIAVTAAHLAAEVGGPIGMGVIRQAAHLEAAKQDRAIAATETRGWAP